MLALTANDVRVLVPMADAIPLMKAAFADLSAGRAYAPVRTPVPTAAENGVTLVMPAAVPSVAGLGLKVVSVFPRNPAHGKPLIYALVVLIDPTDGAPLAVLDGTGLTALRTGAVSGAATDLLARPDAQILALFGAGVQAVTQARAVCAVRPITEIRVYSRTPERVTQFIAAMHETDPAIGTMMRPANTSAEALRGAHIVCTATTATAPLFNDKEIAPGMHLNAVGAYTPDAGDSSGNRSARLRRGRPARGGVGGSGRPDPRTGRGPACGGHHRAWRYHQRRHAGPARRHASHAVQVRG